MLVRYSAKEHQELNELHLIWPVLVDNGVDQRLHRLRKDHAHLHLGHIQAYFLNVLTALGQRYELLFVVGVRVIHLFEHGLVLFQYFIDFHVVALKTPKRFAIHFLRVREDVFLQ